MTARAALRGLAQVSAVGSGLEALREALRGRRPVPERVACGGGGDGAAVGTYVFRAARVDPAGLANPAVTRRMDAFSMRALHAATQALREAGEAPDPRRTGLLVASAYGPLGTMFGFIDQMIDKGDARASPVLFTSSLHNSLAAFLTLLLGCRGPSLTVSGYHHAFGRALEAALGWLGRGEVDRVLLVACDEFHPALGYGLARMDRCAPDGRLRPFVLDRPGWVCGETCVAFVLERPGGAPSPWGTIAAPVLFRGALPAWADEDPTVPVLLAARGDVAEGRGYAAALPRAAPVAAYAPLWGSSPTSEAMTLAAAAIALADRARYPVPDFDGIPAGLRVVEPGPLAADRVQCCMMDPDGNGLLVTLHGGC